MILSFLIQARKGRIVNKNKRRFTRIQFKVGARVEVGIKSYNVNEIYNLSIGGCLLPLNTGLQPGDKCIVKIILSKIDDNMNVETDGEIVRSDDNMTAIKFIRIDPDSLFHLQNIIRYNAPDANVVEDEIDKHPGIL